MNEYAIRDFPGVQGLRGIADALIRAHLNLYEGYVKNINLLNQRLRETKSETPEWAELHRRVGFEINGMRLHEFYFENLAPGGKDASKRMRERLSVRWGSFDDWKKEFTQMGLIRGVGWVILYQDPVTGGFSNHWINLHQDGHPAGFSPVLVLDVWEHAFSGMERPKYLQAFFDNADFEKAESRLSETTTRRVHTASRHKLELAT